jgi:uncharacterized protein YlxW (UPF0749 family)
MRRIVNGFRVFVAAVFMVGLFAAATPQASAECKAEEKAERHLREAERKHGNNSRQVQNARRQLEEARERCRNRHHHHR